MGSGQQQGDDKNSMAILWIIAGVFLLGAVIWWSFAPQLKYFFIKLRMVQLFFAYWTFKFLPFKELFYEIESAFELAKNITPNSISLNAAEYLSILVGEIYRWPIMIGLILFAYLMYGRNIKMRYKKRYDMSKLADQEKGEWPQINPVIGVDLVEADLDKGPWAMGITPVMFCRKYQLLDISIAPPSVDTINKGPKFVAALNKAKADHLFAKQIGRLWRGPEKLPLHRRALFAAFIARGMRDTKSAQGLMLQINRSATCDHSKPLDFTGVDELWKKHYNAKDVQKVVKSHAYEFTLFTGLFLFSRQDGVFATSDFLWLKPRDRFFWYVLNSVGRQTPHCEVAGVHAHFLAEKSLGRSLSVPMINEATKALQIALDELIYTPTDEEKEQLLQSAETEGA